MNTNSLLAQKTIKTSVSCSGIGLHSGEYSVIKLFPAPPNSGIVFRRTDVPGTAGIVEATYSNVVETNLGTTISNKFGVKIATVEHLMAAIWGCGIDNIFIDINGPEIPIMDGSSEPFVFLLECAGGDLQDRSRSLIKVTKQFTFRDGDKFITIDPSDHFSVNLGIDFDNSQIGKQNLQYSESQDSFKTDIARARTFALKRDVDKLHSMGLAKGGSMDNAILVDEDKILNAGGLRYKDEFVRHKTLDFVGDIYLAGHIIGNFKAAKSGHGVNNAMLRSLLQNNDSWVKIS